MINKIYIISFALISITFFSFGMKEACNISDCTFKGHKLYGKIQYVDKFPDIKVQVVNKFPELKVQIVDKFPDKCGKWQIVESFPDLKVQVVESFPDIKIQYVEEFPGMN